MLTSCTAPLLFLRTSRAHLNSTPVLTATASLRTTYATSSTTAGTTLTRTPTSAVRPPPLMSDLPKIHFQISEISDRCFFFVAVFQRDLADAAILSLTSVPGVRAERMTSIGWSKRAALQRLAPGHRVTTPWGTPRDTTSTWRAPSPRQPETLPAYQDLYWAAGAHSARWGGGSAL